jgi:threonine/homoserine/homoserine lactone efflux protein
MTDPILFILAVLSLLAAPGPTNVLLATTGATAGVRASIKLLGAALAGYLLAVAALRLALGPVIEANPGVGLALKVAVALYLVWVAIALWRRSAALTGDDAVTLQAMFVTTLLNPKSLVFAFGILPAAHASLWAFVAALAVAILVVGLGWVVIGRAIGAASGQQHSGIIRKFASVTLVGFAAWLVGSTFG